MLEAGVPDVGGAGAAPLEQRVRGNRRPVREALSPAAGAHRARRGEHRLLLPRRGRHLGRPDPPLLDEHRVGERAADVDAQDRHVRTLHRHARSAPSSSTSTASSSTPSSPSRAGWERLYREHGHELPADLWATLVGTTHAPWDPMAHLEELVGEPLEREALNERRYAHEIALIEAEELRPGIAEYLAAARRHGLKRAIVSSSTRALGGHAPRAARGGGRLGRDLHRRPRSGPREARTDALPRGARRARGRPRTRRSRSRTRRTASWRRRRPASSASRSRTRSRATSGSRRPAPTSSSTRSPTCRPRPCSAGSQRNRVARMAAYEKAHIDEIASNQWPHWIPVRHHFGIETFGINLWRGQDDGTVIPEHDESGERRARALLRGRGPGDVHRRRRRGGRSGRDVRLGEGSEREADGDGERAGHARPLGRRGGARSGVRARRLGLALPRQATSSAGQLGTLAAERPGPVAQRVFKTRTVVQPTARSVRLRRRSASCLGAGKVERPIARRGWRSTGPRM